MFDGVLDLNLIHLFTFYLAVVFLLSTVRRLRQYHDVVQLAVAAPNRWPRVLEQLRRHWIMFMTWATLRPAAVALGLLVVQMVCSRLIWPSANLTLRGLLDEWWLLPLVLAAMAAMLAVDVYFIASTWSHSGTSTRERWWPSRCKRRSRRGADCCTAPSGGCPPRRGCGSSTA